MNTNMNLMDRIAESLKAQEAAEQVEVRPKKTRHEFKTHPGRGKGSINKATIGRTAAFRGALNDEDWEDIAIETFNRMMDPTCKNADFVKLALFLARYNLLSADAQMVIEADSGRLEDSAIDALKNMIKNDGAMACVPKVE